MQLRPRHVQFALQHSKQLKSVYGAAWGSSNAMKEFAHSDHSHESLFCRKGPCAKNARWYAWFEAYQHNISEFSALRMLLEDYFEQARSVVRACQPTAHWFLLFLSTSTTLNHVGRFRRP